MNKIWQIPSITGPKVDISKSMTVKSAKEMYDMIHPANEIREYSSEGNDSVSSEDFEPGSGCVIVPKEFDIVMPDLPPLNWTAADQRNYEDQKRTEQEQQEQQMEYLSRFGL